MGLGNLRIGQRLALGFGVVIALMVVLTGIGIQRVLKIDASLQTIDQVNSVKQRYAINFRGSVHDRAISLRDVVLVADPAQRAEAEATIVALARDYADSAAPLDRLLAADAVADPVEREILDSIKAIEAETLPLIDEVRSLQAAGDAEAARRLLLDRAKPAFSEWLARINRFIDRQEAKNQREAQAAIATANGFAMLMLALSVVALALGATVALLITRSVVRPLQVALDIAQRVGDGDLGSHVAQAGRDETGQLLTAMQRMQDRLVAFSSAQREIAARHEAGQTSFRIDADAHPGAYGTMARDINELVAAHISINDRVVSLVDRYAIGDFSAGLETLPGEQARISEAIGKTRHNLTVMSGEIKRLSSAAAAGDFSARGDVERFQFDYRTMIEDLNRLMATADANLGEISGVFAALAHGDLSTTMHGEYPGVFGRIRDDARDTCARLTEIVRNIQHAADALQTASGEIASGNADLSERTERQAASLQQTRALMEELTSKVRHNSDNAQRANVLACGAGDVAQAGGQAVGEVVKTMAAIDESSRRIVDIIGVIDGIAFQTNILALNAAVEAARAGDQGRGFAVVAAEVRTLAKRSADAARDIKGLIEGAVQRVSDGTLMVDRAGATMREIISSVSQVTAIMGDITTASSRQSQDIDQVSLTVTHLDEVTQQNAALVEEASAAAHGMQAQAGGLADAVAVFRLAPAARQRAQLRAVAAHPEAAPA